ncbi:MAG: hypothetical protein U0900_04725 [Myxococcota bacterium]
MPVADRRQPHERARLASGAAGVRSDAADRAIGRLDSARPIRRGELDVRASAGMAHARRIPSRRASADRSDVREQLRDLLVESQLARRVAAPRTADGLVRPPRLAGAARDRDLGRAKHARGLCFESIDDPRVGPAPRDPRARRARTPLEPPRQVDPQLCPTANRRERGLGAIRSKAVDIDRRAPRSADRLREDGRDRARDGGAAGDRLSGEATARTTDASRRAGIDQQAAVGIRLIEEGDGIAAATGAGGRRDRSTRAAADAAEGRLAQLDALADPARRIEEQRVAARAPVRADESRAPDAAVDLDRRFRRTGRPGPRLGRARPGAAVGAAGTDSGADSALTTEEHRRRLRAPVREGRHGDRGSRRPARCGAIADRAARRCVREESARPARALHDDRRGSRDLDASSRVRVAAEAGRTAGGRAAAAPSDCGEIEGELAAHTEDPLDLEQGVAASTAGRDRAQARVAADGGDRLGGADEARRRDTDRRRCVWRHEMRVAPVAARGAELPHTARAALEIEEASEPIADREEIAGRVPAGATATADPEADAPRAADRMRRDLGGGHVRADLGTTARAARAALTRRGVRRSTAAAPSAAVRIDRRRAEEIRRRRDGGRDRTATRPAMPAASIRRTAVAAIAPRAAQGRDRVRRTRRETLADAVAAGRPIRAVAPGDAVGPARPRRAIAPRDLRAPLRRARRQHERQADPRSTQTEMRPPKPSRSFVHDREVGHRMPMCHRRLENGDLPEAIVVSSPQPARSPARPRAAAGTRSRGPRRRS